MCPAFGEISIAMTISASIWHIINNLVPISETIRMDKLDAMNAFARVVADRQLRGGGAPARPHALGGEQGGDRTGAGARRAAARPDDAPGHADRGGARLFRARAAASWRRSRRPRTRSPACTTSPRDCSRSTRRCRSASSTSASAVAEFMVAYPDLKIELTAQRSLHRSDRGRRGCHGADRRAGGFEPDCAASSRRRGACSPRRPAISNGIGAPQTPDDLAQHRALSFGHSSAAQRWELSAWRRDRHRPGRLVPVLEQRRRAARPRRSTATASSLLPTFLIGPDIKAGKLKVVLPDYPPTELGIYAVYAPNRFLAAKTRLFIDFLSARFGPRPAWDEF